jgi:CyaY protein
MDDAAYQKLADATFHRIMDLFEDVDPDVVDCEHAGDVVTLTFASGQRCIVNTQRPTHQIWLAAVDRAWHFSYDQASSQWLDDKGQGVELFGQIRRVVKDLAGIEIP